MADRAPRVAASHDGEASGFGRTAAAGTLGSSSSSGAVPAALVHPGPLAGWEFLRFGLDRKGAERALRGCLPGTFLLRAHRSDLTALSLSFVGLAEGPCGVKLQHAVVRLSRQDGGSEKVCTSSHFYCLRAHARALCVPAPVPTPIPLPTLVFALVACVCVCVCVWNSPSPTPFVQIDVSAGLPPPNLQLRYHCGALGPCGSLLDLLGPTAWLCVFILFFCVCRSARACMGARARVV